MRQALPWGPEFELLACLCRPVPTAADDARAATLAANGVNWDHVLRLAQHHGVVPAVHASLVRLPSRPASTRIRERLRLLRLESTRSDLALCSAWRELCHAFDAAGIPALTLKGFHVVHWLYGQVGDRPVGDLDYLVSRDRVGDALALLHTMGYAPFPDWQAALRHVGLPHILASTHELALVNARGVVVDLHWAAGPPGGAPSTDALLACAVRFAVGDQEVLVPPPDAAVALLLLHGHTSAWARLRWLVDVMQAMDRLGVAEVAATARWLDPLRMRRALANALHLARDVWGPPAAMPLAAAQEGPVHMRSLHYARRALAREHDWPHRFDFWRPARMLQDRVGRAPSWSAAAAAALQPNYYDWAWVGLPRALRLGYYAVRPWRVARQAVAMRRERAVAARPSGPSVTPPSRPGAAFTLVTAIYDDSWTSLLGGRGRGLAEYLPSLRNLANLGAPIVVFCPAKDAGAITEALRPLFCDVRVVPFALSQFEHFEAFLPWKQAYRDSLAINDRNEVLVFLKSYWVQQAIVDNPFGHDQYFWIDAGLSHHGIFPESVGGVELRTTPPASHYHPLNSANIFSPALGLGIANAAPRGRVLFCALPFQQVPTAHERAAALVFDRPPEAVRIRDHLVGGLFGGYREDLRTVHALYARLLAHLIATRTYTLEEQVFSAVHAAFPEYFALRRFETWWFYAPGQPNARLASEGNSFYKTFVGLAAAGPHQPARS